ncbi:MULTISPECIES: GreA/GreB family elongation factor [Priestia]|uniref:GreA/GreB family elongation factor n=1 Tax=Priestia TaxID=2800373 RepID=UPI001FB46391|nr:GreA/GreB family elongation factor [Priestia aryabhattai]
MSHKVYHPLGERLMRQLAFIDENCTEFTSAYFSSDTREYLNFFYRYAHEVQKYLLSFSALSEDISVVPKVFIGSQVSLMYLDDKETEQFTICFPDQSDPDEGNISFLSPVGSQLLLRSAGDKLVLTTPGGSTEVIIKEIKFKSHW